MKTDSQIQNQLNEIAQVTSDLNSAFSNGRLFDVLELLRDKVRDLSHEHESIRNDVRDVLKLLMQQQSAGPAPD